MYVMHNIGNQYDINQMNKRIKEMRKLRGYTQQAVSDFMSCHQIAHIS